MMLRPAILALLLAASALPAQAPAGVDSVARVDGIFARWNTATTPGCAVAVARDGRTLIERAWGMADLERDVPLTPTTVFEAGSVSKQFTAAAVVLLARQGKLGLDDDVRKHLPELPDYGTTITLRHMLNHTSGLRDWGVVAQAGGWPRGSRNYTQAHVLDIARRQRSLNFAPGSEYLYSNTNYNLMAIIVERVSGVSFAEFTRREIFAPLGMSDTQWRDDWQRIVKRRAVAYGGGGGGGGGADGFRIEMPAENAHGNGGLLTTVQDLLRWNQHLTAGTLGNGALTTELERRGVLTGGREIDYALGLFVRRGPPLEISHDGATGGYRAHLARYPEQRLSVALLCNVGGANPTGLGRQVADVFLPPNSRIAAAVPAPGATIPADRLGALVGQYRNARTGAAARLTLADGKLRLEDGPELVPLSESTFALGASGVRFTLGSGPARTRPGFLMVTPAADTVALDPVPDFAPSERELQAYAGEYTSDEADATYTVLVERGTLVVRDRIGADRPLMPIYPDAFTSRGTLIRFMRDGAGRVTALSMGFERVRDLRFTRLTTR